MSVYSSACLSVDVSTTFSQTYVVVALLLEKNKKNMATQ